MGGDAHLRFLPSPSGEAKKADVQRLEILADPVEEAFGEPAAATSSFGSGHSY